MNRLTVNTFKWIWILLFISCGSSEENIESFAKSHEPVSITDLKEKFNDYKGELIVFEGTVDLLCCGKRVEPIIDLKEYIYSDGNVINVALGFKKEDLGIVRKYSTGMHVKIVGYVDYMEIDKEFLREVGAVEYYIRIKDCVIIPEENVQQEDNAQLEQQPENSANELENMEPGVEEITPDETLPEDQSVSDIYFHILDPDGYSNLRDAPNGEIIRKVYPNEKFRVTDKINSFMKVLFDDGSTGYIHESRVVTDDAN